MVGLRIFYAYACITNMHAHKSLNFDSRKNIDGRPIQFLLLIIKTIPVLVSDVMEGSEDCLATQQFVIIR